MTRQKKYKSRESGSEYYLVGCHKIDDDDVLELWLLMCGEDAIKKFLRKCEKDDGWTIPELKVPETNQ